MSSSFLSDYSDASFMVSRRYSKVLSDRSRINPAMIHLHIVLDGPCIFSSFDQEVGSLRLPALH
jgi:hypothetical protein